MANLDISFPDTPTDAPDRFAEAEVRIGDHRETVFSDQSVWSKDDYIEHWRVTSEIVSMGGSPVLFCSSLGQDNADLWIGKLIDGNLTIFNINTPSSDLSIDNRLIIQCAGCDDLLENPSKEWSAWVVPIG